MIGISRLRNPIQEYAWGSRTFIPELLGESSSPVPKAEMWMGAHPNASSAIRLPTGAVSLLDVLKEAPDEMLGKKISET